MKLLKLLLLISFIIASIFATNNETFLTPESVICEYKY